MICPTAHLAQQIRTSDDIINGPRADTCQDFPDFLRVESDEVHNFIGIARKFCPKFFFLCANAHRAGVGLTLTDHDTAHRNQRRSADTIFFGAHHGSHDDITACAQSPISPQGDPVAQVVHRQNLMRLCQAHFPWQTCKFDRRSRRGPCATIVS